MEPVCYKILEAWASYTKYDENRTAFNLNSFDYDIHSTTKKIAHITDTYDETGFMAVMTVKDLFYTIIKDTRSKISPYELFVNPTALDTTKAMYDMFNCQKLKELETDYVEKLNALITSVVGRRLIGASEIDSTEELTQIIRTYTSVVINSLDKCHAEVYKKSGKPIADIDHFSTKISVFPSLATCLLTLDKAPDGIYLCYIDIHKSADSYFGFFIKSNGNILSFNDRATEAYKGQHSNSRNGRWTEAHAEDIFPYDYIFNYDNYDYKGYAKEYNIDESKLSFFELTDEVYLPLILGMIFTCRKFVNDDLSKYETYYTDALLETNMAQISEDKHELMVLSKNEIVAQTANLNLSFDRKTILDGSMFDEFKESREIISNNVGQIFVDLYGQDFEPQPVLNNEKYLIGDMGKGKSTDYISEMVATEHGMRAHACYDIRQQLAAHIKQKMFEEYIAYGGADAVQKWFEELIKANIDKLKDLAVEAYIEAKLGKRYAHCSNGHILKDGEYGVNIDEGHVIDGTPYGGNVVNNRTLYPLRFYDLDTNATCNVCITIFPSDYTAIEKIFGVEVPKIVKGWQRHPTGCVVNCLLNKYDAVERVTTPFGSYANVENKTYTDDRTRCIEFFFSICFAKRGLAMNAKRLGYDLNKILKESKEEKS